MKCFRKAEMGMGTLIIFIAMILVAAVAAGVLIATTSSLQNKALATGKSTTAEVGTSLNVVQIYAENGSNQNVEELTQIVKLNAGSDPIRFADLLLSVNLDDQAADYVYNGTLDCAVVAQTIAGGDFGIVYSINGTNNKAGYLTKGDVVKLCYEAPRSISESERFIVSLVPKVGTPSVVDTALPDLMINQRIQIFP